MSVIEEIVAERKRQIEVEGWTPEHDDEYFLGHMAFAAAAYAHHAGKNDARRHPWEVAA